MSLKRLVETREFLLKYFFCIHYLMAPTKDGNIRIDVSQSLRLDFNDCEDRIEQLHNRICLKLTTTENKIPRRGNVSFLPRNQKTQSEKGVLVIVLSVHRYTDSDYPFGIFKFFLGTVFFSDKNI